MVSELKKLNRALLFNFLELLEVLVKNPVLYQKKVDDLEVIFVNMHHLLNSFRPHQARSYIISVLEEQVTKKKQAVETLRSVFANVEVTMKQLSQQIEKEAEVPAESKPASAMEVRYSHIIIHYAHLCTDRYTASGSERCRGRGVESRAALPSGARGAEGAAGQAAGRCGGHAGGGRGSRR